MQLYKRCWAYMFMTKAITVRVNIDLENLSSSVVVSDNKFIQKGFKTLSTAAGLAQFYDRDAPAEMAKAGMEGFQEFMIKPDRLDAILKRLDKIQDRVYK